MNEDKNIQIKPLNPIKTEFFECQCYTPEHTLRLAVDNETGDVYLSVFLWKWSFFKRIWIAIKYICGYTSKYGDFDSGTLFHEEDLKKLETFFSKARKIKKDNKAVMNVK